MESHSDDSGKSSGDSGIVGSAIARLFNLLESGQPRRFSREDILRFTNNCSEKIGKGGFSIVYRGEYTNGQQLAVKVLTEKDVVEAVFIAEVKTIATISHRNLVKLYGYCFDDKMKALVYEYMEKGSLDQLLFGSDHSIEWSTFYGIAIETAKAISYLHEDCDNTIIHYDVKPSNVLLDSKFCPKVTDFGLAMLKERDVSHITMTGIRGTPGYGAPELWQPSAATTTKCDVYSFGMMLFEILGRRSNTRDTQKWFPLHVWEMFNSGKLHKLLEECGIKENDRNKAKNLTRVALLCSQLSPRDRPTMSDVANMLQEKIRPGDPRNPFPFYSTATQNLNGGSSSASWAQPTQDVIINSYQEFPLTIDESEQPVQEIEDNMISWSTTITRSSKDTPYEPKRNMYIIDSGTDVNVSVHESIQQELKELFKN